jgi:hypothetical protein
MGVGTVMTTKTYQGYTRDQLSAAIDLVTDNQKDWKDPIDIIVAADADQALIDVAVTFYTGSVPVFTAQPDGRVRVTAEGYYNAMGE